MRKRALITNGIATDFNAPYLDDFTDKDSEVVDILIDDVPADYQREISWDPEEKRIYTKRVKDIVKKRRTKWSKSVRSMKKYPKNKAIIDKSPSDSTIGIGITMQPSVATIDDIPDSYCEEGNACFLEDTDEMVIYLNGNWLKIMGAGSVDNTAGIVGSSTPYPGDDNRA